MTQEDLMTLKHQVDTVKGAVADKAISIVKEYRQGRHHGREVSLMLSCLFESANDTVERCLIHRFENKNEAQSCVVKSEEEKP